MTPSNGSSEAPARAPAGEAAPDPAARDAQRRDFILRAGWAGAEIAPFPGDASTRRYFRLQDRGRRAVLMDAPAGAEAPACPPDADAAARAALGYNASARLAGPNTAAFAGLARALSERGFSAPRVEAADLQAGFILMEDLGDGLFARVIPSGAHEGALYAAAADTLAAVYRSSFPERFTFADAAWDVLDYDAPAMLAEAELLLDWYAPHRAGREIDAAGRRRFREAFGEAFAALWRHAPGLVLRDYHAENLLWLPEREGEARVGLLDFQDALFGHPAYDLVSLLEDARRDVSPDLAAPLKARFVDAAGLADAAAFDAAYAVAGAQRNAKILGIFVRLAHRDGKPRYLDLLARVGRHFAHDLEHPALADVRAVIAEILPEALQEGRP